MKVKKPRSAQTSKKRVVRSQAKKRPAKESEDTRLEKAADSTVTRRRTAQPKAAKAKTPSPKIPSSKAVTKKPKSIKPKAIRKTTKTSKAPEEKTLSPKTSLRKAVTKKPKSTKPQAIHKPLEPSKAPEQETIPPRIPLRKAVAKKPRSIKPKAALKPLETSEPPEAEALSPRTPSSRAIAKKPKAIKPKAIRKTIKTSEAPEEKTLSPEPPLSKTVARKTKAPRRKTATALEETQARATVRPRTPKAVSKPPTVRPPAASEAVLSARKIKKVIRRKPEAKEPSRKARTVPKAQISEAVKPEPLQVKLPSAKAPTVSPTKDEPRAKPAPRLPKVLFEGDEPSTAPVRSRAHVRWTEPAEPEKDRLPEAYGSGRLSLVARDPHSIYAHWDFTPEQQERYNARSVDKHLVLLIWEGGAARRLISELALHPESLHWFVHVPTAGGTYHAELGYYDESRQWTTLAVSETLTTPGGAHRAPDAPVFARMMIEPEPTLAPMLPSEPRAASSAEPPVGAIEPKDQPSEVPPALESEKVLPVPSPALDESLERSGLSRGEVSDLPAKRILPALEDVQPVRRWTPEEAWEILDLTGLGPEGAVLGSMEVVKLFQGFAGEGPGISSLEVPEFGIQVERPAEEAITSPGALQGPQKGPGFWLKVNAELVIYGATEPDAAVTIGGRRIRLRPDGSFSYRFSLPDGRHELPIKAVSVDGDVRGATLRFGRETFYQGEVGAHEQDPSLVPPSPANIPQ